MNGSWASKADYSVCMEQIKGVIDEDKKKEDKLVSLLDRWKQIINKYQVNEEAYQQKLGTHHFKNIKWSGYSLGFPITPVVASLMKLGFLMNKMIIFYIGCAKVPIVDCH